jgi:hypothetical protein
VAGPCLVVFKVFCQMPKKLNIESLRKISIKKIVQDGSWSTQFVGGLLITLAAESNQITLYVNGYQQPVCWPVYERTISGNLRRGGFIPYDKCWDWYIWSQGKRYHHARWAATPLRASLSGSCPTPCGLAFLQYPAT